MILTDRMTSLGFDDARLKFGLRTAFAACLALLIAWLLGLEHPQWSGMTVWAASQPLRGQLLEKSFFRALGTLVGVVAGVALVVVSHDKPAVLIVGLSLWIGLCAGVGNVLRGFVSYGTMLAGYSAAMVALLDTGHPDHIVALGLDRLFTVLVGVLVALMIGLLLAPRQAGQAVAERVRRLSARVLDDMAKRLVGTPAKIAEEQQAIISEMAAIEETLDPHGAGSLRSRQAVRAIRSLMTSQVAALLWLRRGTLVPVQNDIGAALGEAARALATPTQDPSAQDPSTQDPSTQDPSTQDPSTQDMPAQDMPAQDTAAIAAMEKAAHLATLPSLREVILTMETALRDQLGFAARGSERPQTRQPVILHRDWVGAREALIRAAGSMLAVGALWLVSGFSAGAFLLLGTAIMMSVFSTFDNPTQTLRSVILGQILGAAGALACRWLVWPFADSAAAQVLLMMPFVLVGAFLFSHRRTTVSSFDYNMVMLLLLNPSFPPTESFSQSVGIAVAVIAGPSAAYFAYRLIFPVTARRRMETLIAMMVHELQDMAAATDTAKNRPVWRARLYYRLLRLVRWAEKTGETKLSVTDGSLAVLEVGSAILRIQDLLRQPGIATGTARALTAVLRRMRTIGREPERARRALDLAAARLKREGRIEAEQIAAAARALAASLVFFHRAAA